MRAHDGIAAANEDRSGGTVQTRGNALDVSGATVRGGLWKLVAPSFTLDDSIEATGANGSTGDHVVTRT